MMIRVLGISSVTSLESNSSATVPMVSSGIVAPVIGRHQLQLLAAWRMMVLIDHVPKNTMISKSSHCDFYAKYTQFLNRNTDCSEIINDKKWGQ